MGSNYWVCIQYMWKILFKTCVINVGMNNNNLFRLKYPNVPNWNLQALPSMFAIHWPHMIKILQNDSF